ncbi:MAG: hypothetical protein Q6364_12820 [Candidatus Hermodarchaeota archaeon]|nr:hypothetical protein [Candidatus Hermodarchaeota archaeon]
MTNNSKLQEIERKAFISYHGDGILDICIGSALLVMAFFIWLLPEFWFFVIGGLIGWISLYTGAKKLITAPRLGYVEFSSVRRRRIQNIMIAGVLMLVVFNILGVLAIINPIIGIFIFESAFTILIVGIIGAFVLALIGTMLNIRRFYSYSVVFLGVAVVTFFIPLILLLPLIVVSIVMLVYGLFLLYQFVQMYPKEARGEVTGA